MDTQLRGCCVAYSQNRWDFTFPICIMIACVTSFRYDIFPSGVRATRRRQCRAHLLAGPVAVRAFIEYLRLALPKLIPHKDKELVQLLRAARHIQRYPATDMKLSRRAMAARGVARSGCTPRRHFRP